MTKRVLLASAMLVVVLRFGTAQVEAQSVTVPSDIAVTFSAVPTENLSPGALLSLTITATNLGPQPVDTLVLDSPVFTTQFDFTHASVTCTGFGISVLDGIDGPAQFMNWYVAAVPLGTAPFPVGETRTCEIQLALSTSAPPVVSFSFGLAHDFVDANPNNDRETITLREAVSPIPTLSVEALMLLASLVACAALRQRSNGP